MSADALAAWQQMAPAAPAPGRSSAWRDGSADADRFMDPRAGGRPSRRDRDGREWCRLRRRGRGAEDCRQQRLAGARTGVGVARSVRRLDAARDQRRGVRAGEGRSPRRRRRRCSTPTTAPRASGCGTAGSRCRPSRRPAACGPAWARSTSARSMARRTRLDSWTSADRRSSSSRESLYVASGFSRTRRHETVAFSFRRRIIRSIVSHPLISPRGVACDLESLACSFSLLTAAPASAQFDSATVVGTVRDASSARRAGGEGHADRRRDRHLRRQDVDRQRQLRVSGRQAGHLRGDRGEDRLRPGAGRERAACRSARGCASICRCRSGRSPRRSRSPRRRRCSRPTPASAGRSSPAIRRGRCRSSGASTPSLALLTTGVKLGGSSLTTGNTPREGAFNVNGLRSTFNNFLIDGVDNNAYGTSNQGFSNQVMQPPPDAIGEFKVVTNNMSAEYGRAAGATINVAYRSGTNALHGSGWEFLRDTTLNATGFFKPATGKPPLERHQFGGVRRRPDRQEQGVLLRRLRGVPADAQGRPAFSTHRHAGAAAGHPRRSTCAIRAPAPSIRPARRSR